ncbi:hypothetical protein ABIA00_004567 [Bradyrhizobium ottawaense]|uniref:hypothetical protein n=1 Tax=Bradyrhizobium ottawaense TaxID=931866 RepID=UPI003839868C
MMTSLQLAAVVAGALGLSRGTVVQHLRNLQKGDKITFAGHGRGAAPMGPGDAARLLIAAAGSDAVKDSLATLNAFGELLPIRTDGRPRPQVTFLDHLTGLLTEIASAPRRDEKDSELPKLTNVAFTIVSAACEDRDRHPRFAISKTGTRSKWMGAISFGPRDWEQPMMGESDFAMQLRGSGSGLIRVKIVTLDALHAVGGSL